MHEQWWKPALVFYAKATAWIIGPLGAGLIVMYRFGLARSLWKTALIFGLGFAATCYGVWREIKAYKKTIE